RNLVRAVTRPYPGAFSHLVMKKVLFWSVAAYADRKEKGRAGTVLSADPLSISCVQGRIQVLSGQVEDGVYMSGAQLARELNLVEGMRFGPKATLQRAEARRRNVLILGVNGFIGSALSERLLESGKYVVHGMDLWSNNIQHLLNRPGFEFDEGDISIHREWL